jgi:PAS domain-containing protein
VPGRKGSEAPKRAPIERTPAESASAAAPPDAAERRRQHEAKWRLLLDAASDAIFLHPPGGRFIEVNQTACTRLGFSRCG